VLVIGVSQAIDHAHAWFETHSGWAPPDAGTLAEWLADGICRCPDECLVPAEGWCDHGLASWWLILTADAHDHAVRIGEPSYRDPASGLFVMTATALRARGVCCALGCRHCPFESP